MAIWFYLEMKLAWGWKVSEEFRTKVLGIVTSFNWPMDPYSSWLMACIAFESSETFSPTIRNAAGSGAIGLIQFMPATARYLGTSVETLAQMTAVEQLEYVRKYFYPYASRIKSLSDMYMSILLPRYVGSEEDAVLFLSPTISYRQNAGLDANKDGKITKKEATLKVMAKLEKGMKPGFVLDIK